MKVKVVVVIPAFNEEQSIEFVLRDIPRDLVDRVIVVDNNSLDKTAECAKREGAHVVHEPNRGYGNACLAGMRYAKQFKPDVVVFLDGDYSDHPQEMNALIDKIKENYDIVVGSRTLGKAEPGALLPQAKFGNRLAAFLIKILFGFQYTDLGPFRAIKWNKLLELEMGDPTFGWTVEMQIKAVKRGLRIAEVPVSYRARIGVSKITGTFSGTVKAGYKILWTIFRYALI
ncbi:MAG: glycosyltransferase family 2 protein [bacterium]